MAWRIADYVERGEIDNREQGRITGQIWLNGIEAPIVLELTGNPHRDLAGQRLQFLNPDPKPMPAHLRDIALEQTGVVGDITAARMDLLNDRITARLEREESIDSETLDRIMDEERERLRRERGEPEPEPLSPEEEAERAEWIEAMNAACEEALEEASDEPEDLRQHPLVGHCHDLACRISEAIKSNDWLPEHAQEEHPLNALQHGLWFGSAKLAGALNGRRDEWPPEALFAGDCLVRLKKARGHLRDSLRGLEAIEAEKLTEPGWWPQVRQEVQAILSEVEHFIAEVRGVLKQSDGML